MDRMAREIIDYLHLYPEGPMTATAIATGISFPARAVATKLCWLRGAGIVSGSAAAGWKLKENA